MNNDLSQEELDKILSGISGNSGQTDTEVDSVDSSVFPVSDNVDSPTPNTVGVVAQNSGPNLNGAPSTKQVEFGTKQSTSAVNSNSFSITNESVSPATSEYMVYCSRCGEPMKNTSRYCMKCGNLNPEHPSNHMYAKMLEKANKKKGFNISDGYYAAPQNEGNVIIEDTFGISSDPAGFNICFFSNIIIYLILAIAIVVYFYFVGDQDILNVLASDVGYYLIGLTAIFFYLYAWELIFMKMNRPWWLSFIPILNFIIIADSVFAGKSYKRICKTITVIPIIGQIFYIYLIYMMGIQFQESGIKTVLLFPIKMPMIAYGGNTYKHVKYTSSTNSFESDYKKKNFFFKCCVIFSVFSVVCIFLSFTSLGEETGKLDTKYFMKVSDIVLNEIDIRIKAADYTCDSQGDDFYFYFEDVSEDISIPFSFLHNSVSVYVMVQNTGAVGGYNYYIAMTNGSFGFGPTLKNDVNESIVGEYSVIEEAYSSSNRCYFNSELTDDEVNDSKDYSEYFK